MRTVRMASAGAPGSGPGWRGACALAGALLWLQPLLLRVQPSSATAKVLGARCPPGPLPPPPRLTPAGCSFSTAVAGTVRGPVSAGLTPSPWASDFRAVKGGGPW
ncbi:hypothetical protein HPG69_013650 [Diceros bicornis minor]|uniref:Uncharacterized protein n=1 Tax=Diceros bicornis minor TaxID=77932 RepID=A0A7J7FM76_DICBM|nr:hypothetical protein HPG69_013650 [Diceros bicornis minor]